MQSWSGVGSAGFSGNTVLELSLALHPTTGVPYVGYSDRGHAFGLTVMAFANDSWSNVGSPGFSTDLVDFVSLAVHPTTFVPHVAFQDGGWVTMCGFVRAGRRRRGVASVDTHNECLP